MTLQEAIKKGCPFKREEWNDWLMVDKDGNIVYENYPYYYHCFTDDDILADDWQSKDDF